MPKSGTFRYQISAIGNYVEQNRVWIAYSTGDYIDVDFTTGQVTGRIGLSGDDFLTGNTGGLGVDFQVKASIDGNTVLGNATFNAETFTGQYKLVFYGPNAEEMGIIFSGGSPFRGMYAASGVGSRVKP